MKTNFAFTEDVRFFATGDIKAVENLVMTCVFRKYDFEVKHEPINDYCTATIVSVDGISEADKEKFSEYIEEDEDSDDDYDDYDDYLEPDNLEMGFNPYMGCYDYDC